MGYIDTFIRVAAIQYELLSSRPYGYTQEEVQ